MRSNDILHSMAGLGYLVTLYPMLLNRFDLAAVYADMPDTVEVMHDRALEQLEEFLLLRKGYYDAIWWHGRTTWAGSGRCWIDWRASNRCRR